MSMDGSGNGRRPIDAYVLVQARPGREARDLAEQVTLIPGVVRADWVYGPYDVIAEIRERRDPGTPSVAQAIGELDGVLRAIPLVSSAGSDWKAA